VLLTLNHVVVSGSLLRGFVSKIVPSRTETRLRAKANAMLGIVVLKVWMVQEDCIIHEFTVHKSQVKSVVSVGPLAKFKRAPLAQQRPS
jgi:bifunctional N-acetylglucosamine-1-phosphate-uridyltransferase/glucosamine-1-phosphate-acetyltransferase GlmU-like protein